VKTIDQRMHNVNSTVWPGQLKILPAVLVAIGFIAGDIAAVQAQTLDEITVTARKREEGLMDAPIALTAVQGEHMDQSGITNLEQLSAQVPGLVVGRAVQHSSIYIRGIGSGFNKGFEQSVGMYVDGVYQVRSRQFTQSLVDLDRVEVLRGPQSILFGKNTVAGAIKAETANPLIGEEFNGSVWVDFEPEQSTFRGTAIFSGGLSDTFAARLAVRYHESDGYVDNQLRGEEQQKEDTLARLTLVWEPSDTLNITGKISYIDMQAEGVEMVNTVADPSLLGGVLAGTSMLSLTDVMGTIAAFAVPGYQASTGQHEYSSWVANQVYFPDGTDLDQSESTNVSLAINWDVSDNLMLSAVTGYSDFEFIQPQDVDFHGGNFVHNAANFEDVEHLSQELRLTSDYDGRFNFIAGLYYEEQDISLGKDTYLDGSLGGVFGQLPASGLNPNLPAVPLSALGINSLWNGSVLASLNPAYAPFAGIEHLSINRVPGNDLDNSSFAVFGEATFDITDTWSIDIGGRYSDDKKELHKFTSLGAGPPGDNVIVQNADGSLTGNMDPLSSTLVGLVWGPFFATWPHDFNLKRSESHFDPSVRLNWQATDDTMAYLSYVEGYKAGGFNAPPDSANPDGSPAVGTEFEEETAQALELGIKSTHWDGRARTSLTFFQTDVDDLQVSSFVGVGFVVNNAAEMRSKGVELETQLALTDEVEVGGSIMYLDSKFESFANAGCTIYQAAEWELDSDCFQDLSGQTTPFAPEWNGAVYIAYERPLGSGLMLRMRADAMYKDEMFLDGDLDPNILQDDYFKINAHVAIGAADDRWEASLYGRNLTDEATYGFMLDAPASAGIYGAWIQEPLVWGMQLRYNF
jgi:iron complex outermembrane receptor protein